MGKKEKKTVPTLCRTALGAVAGYLALQFVNALLMSKEVVGEGGAAALVAVSGLLAVFLSVSILGRREKKGRMVLGLGTAAALVVLQVLGMLAAGEVQAAVGVWPMLWGGALLGGAAGALVGGGGKSRKPVSSRRR